MPTITNLSVKIGADIRDLQRKLKTATKSIRNTGRRMKQVGTTLTMGLTAPIAAAGGMALKTAADFESLQQSMNTLNGSVEEGARNFERLQKFSARTPFQLRDLAEAQNMLQGFGLSADEAFNSIDMIGDIAAVASGDIKGIGIAFGQAAAEGRVMTRDIRQLINQGVPAIKLLSESMGVAESQIFDLASEGEISFQDLQAAMQMATSQGGLFFQGMLKQSRTLQGRFSTMRDNISFALGDLGDAMAGTAKEVMNWVIQLSQSFRALSQESKEDIVALGVALASIGPILVGIGGALLALTSPIALITAGIAGLAAAVLYVWDNWKAVKERISDITWWRNTLIKMVQLLIEYNPISLFIKQLNFLLSYLGEVKIPNIFEGMADELDNLKDDTKEYKNQFGSFTDAVVNGTRSALGWMKQLIGIGGRPFRVMGDAFSYVGNSLANISEHVRQASKFRVFGDAFSYVGNKANEMADAINRASQNARTARTDFQVMGEALTYVGNSLGDVMGYIRKRVSETNKLMIGMFNTLDRILQQAVIHGRSLGNVLQKIAMQLASKALINGLAMLVSGASFGFGSLLFGSVGSIIGLAHGGLAYGPTLATVGDNPNARSNPEVIAPLDKLQGMMGGNKIHITGEFRQRGSDLVAVIDQAKTGTLR